MALEVDMTKKQLIMEKALQLFAMEGYESVGVAKIVEEANVTKPTLYHYFGNKEGLLKSIYEVYFTHLIDQLKNEPPFHQDVTKAIEGLTKTYIEFAKENDLFFWLSNHLRKGPLKSQSHLIVKDFHDEELAIITKLFFEMSDFHTNLKGNEQFLVRNYLNLVNGFIEFNILNQQIDQVSGQQIHQLCKQFLYGIFSL